MDGLIGGAGVTIQKVRKSQAAHGVSVVETFKAGKKWQVQRGSKYGRRITGNTPMRVSGPAAGLDMLKSKKYYLTPDSSVDSGMLNDGYTAFGTLNNCAHGYTPWGTYLTCEENWNGYFAFRIRELDDAYAADPARIYTSASARVTGQVPVEQRRLGVGLPASTPTDAPASTGFGYRWHEVDERFDCNMNPTSPTASAGWWRSTLSIPTASRSSAPRWAASSTKARSTWWTTRHRVAVYMGDDERNEYIYKFVCAGKYNPRNRGRQPRPARHRHAVRGQIQCRRHRRVAAAGAGHDGPKRRGRCARTASPAPTRPRCWPRLIKTPGRRRRGRHHDGPPGVDGARPRIGGFSEIEVYCTLTNNNRRGNTPVSSQQAPTAPPPPPRARPPVDAANPRPDNDLRPHHPLARDRRSRSTATTLRLGHLRAGGDNAHRQDAGQLHQRLQRQHRRTTRQRQRTTTVRRTACGSTASAVCGSRPTRPATRSGDWVNIGGNMMVCADPEHRRDPPLPHQPEELRGHRRDHDAGRQDHVRRHPAPGRRRHGRQPDAVLATGRSQWRGSRRRDAAARRPPAFVGGGDHQGRRRRHRHRALGARAREGLPPRAAPP